MVDADRPVFLTGEPLIAKLVTDSPHRHRWPISWCAGRIARWWCHTPGRSPEEDWRPPYEKSEQVRAEVALQIDFFLLKSMWKTWKDLCKQTRLPPTQIYFSLWATSWTGDLLNRSVAELFIFIQTAVNRLYWISFRLELSCIAVRKGEIGLTLTLTLELHSEKAKANTQK